MNMILIGAIAFFLASVIKNPIRSLLKNSGFIRFNYSGKQIPTSTGVIFVIAASLAIIITAVLNKILLSKIQTNFPCLILALSSSFVGFLDDIHKTCVSKGFKGHLKALLEEGIITTGVIKGVIIWLTGVLSIILSGNDYTLEVILLNATLIGLGANFTNLLDLRPGRALKVFFVIFSILILYDPLSANKSVPFALCLASFPGLQGELNEEYMMGDAGANPLGATLAYWIAIDFPISIRLFVFLILLGVHIYSEFYSISELIDKNVVLRFIDELGRI